MCCYGGLIAGFSVVDLLLIIKQIRQSTTYNGVKINKKVNGSDLSMALLMDIFQVSFVNISP